MKKRIIILGGGFGGLRTAFVLSRRIERLGLTSFYEIVLVDARPFHTYTPLLYEVAATSERVATACDLKTIATHELRDLLRRRPITLMLARVTSLDVLAGTVGLENGALLRADHLVIALGSEPNYYDIPGLEEHALPFKTFADALRIRNELALRAADRSMIRIIVGGGGPTGVELAGEIMMWCGDLERDFAGCRISVSIVQGGRTILPGFSARTIELAKRRLARLGVDIREGKRIVGVEKDSLTLESGMRIPYDIVLWAGGTKIPDLIASLPVKSAPDGRIAVHGRMECIPETADLRLTARTYALGDSVCFTDPITKEPVPAVARAALSQADIVARNIIEDIKAERGLTRIVGHATYRPRRYPYITPVGGKFAIANIGPFVVSGFFGWFFKGLVELNYLLSIMPPWRALRIWLTGLRVFIQNDRLG